ncbi:MAG: VapC toxin family PIN domain ribonuclease [Verrucomicrobia bacterium]|nr:VapC toxin family PIN domain ribonuclease [Verrucomicrobiota bacterium]
MPSLCDVNFLLSLCHGQHQHHSIAKTRLSEITPPGQLVVCRASQLGLLRLLSNPAVMKESVCTTDSVWQVYDTMMSDDRFIYRDEPAGLQAKLREFTKGFPFSPKLWQDAYLAAFAVCSGQSFLTFDHGFDKFPGLRPEILEVPQDRAR